MSDLLRDIRYSARQLGRTPGFTVVAVVTLGLGIAAFTAFFSLANAVAFRPARQVDLDGVLAVRAGLNPAPGLRDPSPRLLSGLPIDQFRALEREEDSPLASVTGTVGRSAVVETERGTDRISVELVSGGYPSVFRLSVSAGRWIGAEDDRAGAPPAAVISDWLCRRWFADRPAVGQPLRVTFDRGGTLVATIVGVATPGFRGLPPLMATDVWLPIAAASGGMPSTPAVFARPVRRNAAGLELELERLLAFPRFYDNGASLTTIDTQPTLTLASYRWTGLAVVALAALVLAAACANLANMLFARRTARMNEVAVRLSLGARPGRILRLFATEAALISLGAAVLGLVAAGLGVRMFGEAFPTWQLNRQTSIVLDLVPDYRVFVAAFASGALAGLLVGVVAAWRSTRVPILRILGGSGAAGVTGRAQLRRSFVAVQVTAALVLVMGAGIALQNLQVSVSRRLHFDAANVLAVHVDRPFDENRSRSRVFYDALERGIRNLDGVTASAVVSSLPAPVSPSPQWTNAYAVPDRALAGAPRRVDVLWSRVTPGFHDALGLPVVQGRPFRPNDVDGSPMVAIVSESTAAALWPDADPLGRELVLGIGDPIAVVGVTPDPASGDAVRDDSHWRFASNAIFVPLAQWWREPSLVLLRGAEPGVVMPQLQALVRDLDAGAAALNPMTAEALVDTTLGPVRGLSILSTTLGLTALGIAMLGVYGVMSYLVGLRTREFGIRLALGARPIEIVRLVLDRTVHVVLVGLLAGVLTATLVAQLAQNQVYGLSPNPLMLWIVVPLLVLGLGIAAGYVPARRASRVEPSVALRVA